MTARLAPIPAPAAEAKVIPRVDDAIDKVIKIGIPYLSEFVKTREGSE